MAGGHLEAGKRDKVITLGDISGGVNLNDPPTTLADNQIQDCLNAVILKKGFKRWPGVENLTAKDACDDYLRGVFNYSEIDGTQHLLTVFGGKLYEINKATGALTLLYTMTGTGEAWGAAYFGTFFLTNSVKVIKVEKSTAYQVGITAPTAGTTAAAAGGSLAAGVWSVIWGYARKVGGLNVLYSAGFSAADVTLAGSPGNATIALSSLANSADPQVNNKVVWLKEPGGTIYYYYGETGNNTSTTLNIASDAAKNNAIDYDAYARNNLPPGAFEFLHVFDNRIWGSIGNTLYYSLKAASVYDLEKFPTLNKITYPYNITGIFSVGQDLYLNTAFNGIIQQPSGNVGSRYVHAEQRYSFRYMRTVADWQGAKIGVTNDGVMVFQGDAAGGEFQPWDYGYNIRPALNKIWAFSSGNFSPCGFTYRRDNRIEYQLSFIDTNLCATNNNRTYVLNLSQSFFQDSNNYKTPWEIVDRGFNYAVVDSSNAIYFGQSFATSSTIYKELLTHTTQKGLYNSAGVYLVAATNMQLTVKYRTIIENMFVKTIVEDLRSLFYMAVSATLSLIIADDLSRGIVSATNVNAFGVTLWDTMVWDTDGWSTEGQAQFDTKADLGVFGYSWFFLFNQLADDIDFKATEFDILTTLEVMRGT